MIICASIILTLLLLVFAFEMGKAVGASNSAERVHQLECGNETLRRSVNFVETENQCLQDKLAERVAQIGKFSAEMRKDLEGIAHITENLSATSLYGHGEIGLIQEETNRFTAAMRAKLDEEFGGY